jgi:hypothetical protein
MKYLNRNMAIRLAIDLTMTILMLVAMAYRITGNTIHEVVGVFLFVLFIVHNILNRRWYKAIAKGKYKIQCPSHFKHNSQFAFFYVYSNHNNKLITNF